MGKKQVKISHELLVDVLSEGWNTDGRAFRCTEGLPVGVMLANVHLFLSLDESRGPDVTLIFEHPDWAETGPLAELPDITPTYQAIQEEC